MLLLTVVGMNSWYGERGPGLFSIILGSVCLDYFLLEPHYTLHVASSDIEAMTSVCGRARELVITTRNIDPDQVQVTVDDSGMGIDPNAVEKIFEPFYTTKSTGMGMGLSITRSILQHHGGRLCVTAPRGRGASFFFTVPKYDEQEANAGVSCSRRHCGR